MIVDTHAHLTPQSMLDALQGGTKAFPSVSAMHADGNVKFAFCGGAPTRPVSPGLRNTEKRLSWMKEQSIDVQVCGGWLDSFGYELPDQEGLAWSRFVNEHLARECERQPRLKPLCTVPLQNGRMAADVLAEAMKAGFGGTMIGTQPKGTSGNLDDPDLDPFWQTASDLGASVYLHPMFGCGDVRLNDYDMINAVGRGVDTTTAVARMLYAGHFTRYAGMKFVLSHGGGALPYMLGRLQRNNAIHKGDYADAATEFQKLYFDTVLFDPAALRFLADKVGTGKIVLGSDYPFPIGDPEPCKVVHACHFGAHETAQILGETAVGLFRIDAAKISPAL